MLELAFADGDPLDQAADLLVIACGDMRSSRRRGPVGRADVRLGGLLRRAAAEERFPAKPGQSLLAHTHGALPAGRVALVGLGSPTGDATRALRIAAGSAARLATTVGAKRAALDLASRRQRRHARGRRRGCLAGQLSLRQVPHRRTQPRARARGADALPAFRRRERRRSAALARARVERPRRRARPRFWSTSRPAS